MRDEGRSYSRLNRRDFLKLSAVAGILTYAAVSGENLVIKALAQAAPPQTATETSEVLYNSACSNNCKQTCRLLLHVYQGNLVETTLNPMLDPRYNRICLRGITHAQRVYHPDRLKYPMKRIGARGAGQWATITWDEAISTIAQQFGRISQQYGSNAVAFISVSGNYGMINGLGGSISRFANVYQGTLLGVSVDQAMPLGVSQVGMSFYGGGNEAEDIADNARTIIVWGSNLTESDIHTWHFMADAIANGAKLIVVDPHFSVIASKAQEWINPQPGSDVALGMSVINVLINENLYNEDFVVNHTVGPFLVSGDTGLFLRESDVTQGGSNKYMVWDPASSGAKTYDQVSNPALTGVYAVGSTTVRPAFQLLSDRVSWFTPENSQGFTAVPPDVVRGLAGDYASRTPASIIPNMGIDRWDNGYLMGRVIGTLAALTGNVGLPGATPIGEIAGFASMWVNNYGWTTPSGTSATPLPQALMYDAIINGNITAYQPIDPSNSSLGAGPEPVQVPYVIKALFSSNGNFVSNNPDQTEVIEQMLAEDKIEFFVAADMFLNDTTAYADIVLPVSSWFEADDIVSGYNHQYLLRQNKAISPLWECMSDFQIFQLLAQEMGLGQYFQGTEVDQIESILNGAAQSLGDSGAAIIDDFRNNDIARFAPSPYIGYSDLNFDTPSGRLEFYSEGELLQYPYNLRISVQNGGDPLVRWEQPMEAWPASDIAKTYPLQCYQEHAKWRVHSTWFNQPWLREIDPEPIVKMNPSDAQARGIQDGDYVEVYNDRGNAVLKAVFNPGVRPGSVNIPHGWQRSQHIAGGYQELTSSSVNPISLNFSYNDLMVEVRKAPAGTRPPSPPPYGQGVNSTS